MAALLLAGAGSILHIRVMKKLSSVGKRLSAYAGAAMVLLMLLAPAPAFAGGPSMDVCGNPGNANSESEPNSSCNKFVENYLNPAIIVLTSLVGIAAVLSIIFAGIQYSSSADDPGMVTKAKQRIFNTILGLVAYIFLLAFLNYLIPGGIFSNDQ